MHDRGHRPVSPSEADGGGVIKVKTNLGSLVTVCLEKASTKWESCCDDSQSHPVVSCAPPPFCLNVYDPCIPFGSALLGSYLQRLLKTSTLLDQVPRQQPRSPSYTQENASGGVFRLSGPLRLPHPFLCSYVLLLAQAPGTPQLCIWKWYPETQSSDQRIVLFSETSIN